jgi:aquaporin Z
MRKYFVEAIGTFLLVFVGTFIITESGGSTIVISLGFGITLGIIVMLFGSVSGAHVNPAVSLGAWIRGDFSTSDIVPYWIAQFIGAIAGSFLLYSIVDHGIGIGETVFTMEPVNAFLIEAVLTFVFVMVIFKMGNKKPLHAALAIGGTLFVIHLIAFSLTGASVNPARSIAPVVVGGSVQAAGQIWVYVLGPFVGAVVAGITARRHI